MSAACQADQYLVHEYTGSERHAMEHEPVRCGHIAQKSPKVQNRRIAFAGRYSVVENIPEDGTLIPPRVAGTSTVRNRKSRPTLA